MILAAAPDGTIGNNGGLPWPMNKDDMQRFRKVTEGRALIMGRKTHESIGKVLPGRLNIVLSETTFWLPAPGALLARSKAEALAQAHAFAPKWNPMIIGGKRLYEDWFDVAETIYLTQMHGPYEGGDVKVDWVPDFFGLTPFGWECKERVRFSGCTFLTYKRTATCQS